MVGSPFAYIRGMNNQPINHMGIWTAIGVAIGGALSAAFENNAVGWALGISIGVAIGALNSRRKSSAED